MDERVLENARAATRKALEEFGASGEPKHSVDRASRRAIAVLLSLLDANEVSTATQEGEGTESYPVPFEDVKISEEFVRVVGNIADGVEFDIEMLSSLISVTGHLHSEILRAVEGRYGRAAAFGGRELTVAFTELQSIRKLYEQLSSGQREIDRDPVRVALVAADRAEAAVGPASEAGLGAEYARISEAEERLRNQSRLLAVAVLLVFSSISVVLLLMAPDNPPNRESLVRAALAIPGGTLFAYFSRQAAVHRRVAQRAAEVAAQLKTIGAFVTQFEDQRLREETLAALARVVFREVDFGLTGDELEEKVVSRRRARKGKVLDDDSRVGHG